MPDVQDALASVARGRARDPLSPVTFVVPSHAAGLQLRRRLAAMTPFAAVRFETLPRIAELIAAGALAAEGRRPLARPIGDYVALEVARESEGDLAGIATLPGYAKVLRQHFRRLRRGGISRAGDVRGGRFGSHLDEVLRLYDLFRARTSGFYDDEDELEAAAEAVRSGRAPILADLGAMYIVPPGPLTAAGMALLEALRARAGSCTELSEGGAGAARPMLVLAPDPASEAREVVRGVIDAISGGLTLQEVAVFHGGDRSYPGLLREHFEQAGIPVAPLPGVPLSEKPVGRAALMLARLPALDYSRVAVMDFLQIAPLKTELPGASGPVRPAPAFWDKLSREAGIVRGAGSWQSHLAAAMADLDAAARQPRAQEDDVRMRGLEASREGLASLASVVSRLVSRLEPLAAEQPAASFIEAFTSVLAEYIDDQAEGYEDLRHEIEQLGTVGAVGGRFSLSSFVEALAANLEARFVRPAKLGEGVLVADYRLAAALRFRRVWLCGAYEGALPAGPGPDSIVDDRSWARLRQAHPLVEDAELRLERASQAVARAEAVASEVITWSCPVFEAAGTRDRYPSPFMVAVATELNSNWSSSSALRSAARVPGVLERGVSPMSLWLRGIPVDRSEWGLRDVITLRRRAAAEHARHRAWPAVTMLRARRSERFTEFDGNLAALAGTQPVELDRVHSPTSLERYASCGFRYFCGSVLRLRYVEEPGERQVMDPAEKGTLIHRILERFFREQQGRGRPALGEAWTEGDVRLILELADEELEAAKARGLSGLDVYAEHEARTIKADLERFLEEDSRFRVAYGTVPHAFEQEIPETEIGGVRIRGRVDRIDRRPDGSLAVVIDYKTGSPGSYATLLIEGDPFAGGTMLQLPAYLRAVAGAPIALSLYWFVTRRGGFEFVRYVPTPESEKRYEETVAAIARGISMGAFPAVPGEEDEWRGRFENCRYCDFTRICSRKRDVEFAAKVRDGAMAPWVSVQRAARGEQQE